MSDRHINVGSIGGNANFGDGDQIGEQNNIAGDNIKAGNVIKGDNANVDASGQTITFMDTPEHPNAGLFDAIRAQFESVTADSGTQTSENNSLEVDADGPHDLDKFSVIDIPELPRDIVETAKTTAIALPTPSDEDVEKYSTFSGLALVQEWEKESELPPEEQDAGRLAAVLTNIRKFAPKVAYGVLAAGEAYLKSKVQSSSVVSAGIAFLAELRS